MEPIFPPELRRRQPAELALPGPRCAWYRPVTLERLLALKAAHHEARLVVGNTGKLCSPCSVHAVGWWQSVRRQV